MSDSSSCFPQLRLRTEHSFRRSYAAVETMAERAAALGAPAAGCVDPNTWGHVRWERACVAAGIEPLFGAELPVETAPDATLRPQAWALARDPAALYRFLSAGRYRPADWAAAEGLVRFAGAGLSAPDTYDYVDVNPESPLATRRALRLHRRYNKPLVVTSAAWYAAPEDRETFLALTDNRSMAPQHVCDLAELRAALPELTDAEWEQALHNTRAVAAQLCGGRLRKAPILKVEGDLLAEVHAGRDYRVGAGHCAWSAEYEARLEHELALIKQKDYESYFLVVGDLVRWAKRHMLVGPARGSSAGSLVCYLLRITEVDPLVHGLLFERFIDPTRDDLPDIDIDFSDRQRDSVFKYLADKYGAASVARLGNVSTLKPRSAMAECGKRLGIPAGETFGVRNVLFEYSSGDSRYGAALSDTLEQTAPGREFAARHAAAARIMPAVEGHAWHTSVHAAGVIVCSEPITNFCSVKDGVCQVDKAASEYLNLLKIDALGLRTLGVIEDAQCVSAEQLYGLKLDDPAVFRVFNERRFAGVFQFEGAAQRRVAYQIPVHEFRQLDHITALARPGPLGGGATNTYIRRQNGEEPVAFRHPSMERYLDDTRGVVLYQEQVMRISREIGQMPWAVIAEIRKAMSGRKGVEYFDRRGAEFRAGAMGLGLSAQEAQTIWDEIVTFGAWGMNRSHTVSYAIISYWCAYMKAYHTLEYAAALLRNAKDDEQALETLRELHAEGVAYAAFDMERSREQWQVVDGTLVGGFQNLVGVGPAKAARYVELRDAGALSDEQREKIGALPLKFSELYPGRSLWGALYADPAAHNIRGPIKHFTELKDHERAVVICRLVRKERRDENETLRLQRRGGRKYRGQSQFLDMFVVDDSITKPIIVRIRPRDWWRWGESLADAARDGEDWFLVRGKWLDQFSMFPAEKIRCLTRPELLPHA